jgi:hypothetical protein
MKLKVFYVDWRLMVVVTKGRERIVTNIFIIKSLNNLS